MDSAPASLIALYLVAEKENSRVGQRRLHALAFFHS
jgi:hypothetical protein